MSGVAWKKIRKWRWNDNFTVKFAPPGIEGPSLALSIAHPKAPGWHRYTFWGNLGGTLGPGILVQRVTGHPGAPFSWPCPIPTNTPTSMLEHLASWDDEQWQIFRKAVRRTYAVPWDVAAHASTRLLLIYARAYTHWREGIIRLGATFPAALDAPLAPDLRPLALPPRRDVPKPAPPPTRLYGRLLPPR